VNVNIDKEEFKKAYQVIVNDIASGRIDSRRFNTKAEREKYIRNYKDELKPDTSKVAEHNSDDFEVNEPPKKTNKEKNSDHKNPTGLFRIKDLPFNAKSNSLKFVYNELRTINVKRFPNATHDLLRSFLECSLVYFLKEVGDYSKIKKSSQHHPKLSEMLTYISKDDFGHIDDSIKSTVKAIKGNYAEAYSLERMNMINHHENWAAEEKEVRITWSKIEKLMFILLNPHDESNS